MMRPHIAVRSTGSRLELDALVRLDGLSAIHPRAPLRIGLSAVIEASDGLSYWALRHPADKPDFHDADGFALLLEPPGFQRMMSNARAKIAVLMKTRNHEVSAGGAWSSFYRKRRMTIAPVAELTFSPASSLDIPTNRIR